ncbi:MAG: AbrB/MazE/SpoVT family DNA-binding domain-containing protein [Nitrososphaera sp.]
MSKKGQIVIPQKIRKNLKIKPRTKFAVYAKNDVIIIRAIEPPDLEKEWREVFRIGEKKNLKINEKEIYDEVQSRRAPRR